MRLYKTQGARYFIFLDATHRLTSARFFSIKYNEGAQEHLSGNGTVEDGLLLSPLSFDAEVRRLCALFKALLTFLQAIHQIVSFFGRVDEINTYALGWSPEPSRSFVFLISFQTRQFTLFTRLRGLPGWTPAFGK